MKTMKNVFTFIFIFSFAIVFSQETYSRVKIFTDSKGLKTLAELGLAVDHGISKKDFFFISDFSNSEILKMRENGFKIEILIDDVKKFYVDRNKASQKSVEKNTLCNQGTSSSSFSPEVPTNFNLGLMGGFFTYQEFLAELDAMKAQYPNLITSKAPISTFLTTENRPLYWLKISDNPEIDETNETEVLYSAIHHAREPLGLSETIFYMWYLLENYATSEEIQFLVNNTEMYFVPCVNPDGYVYNQTDSPDGGGMHRKNRRDVGSSNKGVDLNRNYSYQWGTTGVSFDVNSDTYPGTAAFSENETQAMKWLCNNRDFSFAFNAHTYSNYILYPISSTSEEFAEDDAYFSAFTSHMVQYNGYANMKSSGLYPASGDSDDYMYKEDIANKPEIFAMTPEIGNSTQGFWPASTDITGICKEMVFPNLMLSHLSHKYLVVKDLDPSKIELMTGDFNYSAYRLGNESGNVTVSIVPLLGIQSVGAPDVYNLNLMETQNGAISYVLNPAIQFGDVVKYVIHTDYGGWIHRDTIIKSFGTIALQLFDDASSNSGWTGNWTTTNQTSYSPNNSFTESAGGDYANQANKTYKLNTAIDLTVATSAMVTFYAKWDIEADFDYCQFQVSTDGGTSWIGQCGLYTTAGSGPDAGGVQPLEEPVFEGTQLSWVKEEIDLSDYLGQTILVRFLFESDGGLRKDGFYFDDFAVLYDLDAGAKLDELVIDTKVIPNPANNSVYLSFSSPLPSGVVKVFDQTGKVIFDQKINQLTNKLTIDTSQFPSGIYTVQIRETNFICSPVKLVVVH